MEIEAPKLTMQFKVTEKGQPDINFNYEGNMAQELLDQYQGIVGNGLARVSIGIPMSLKDYGNGVESSVHISLTCNQDAQTIQQAYMLATNAVLFYVKENLGKALAEFDQIMAQRKVSQNQASLPAPNYR